MIIRKNAKAFSLAEKAVFTGAIVALKHQVSQLHAGDATRSRFDDYAEVHLNAMNAMMTAHMQNWGHQSAAFGPWHRIYLHHFETELRAIDATVTIPYWDWTDPACTAAVFAPDFLGSNGRAEDGQVMDGPFAASTGNWNIVIKDDDSDPTFLARQFGHDPSATALPTTAMQTSVMARTIYDAAPWYDMMRTPAQRKAQVDSLFRFGLEVNLHNLVHRYVGGDMALAASPNDPVFFLHHCNLDRLWSLWEQTTGKADVYEPQHNGPAGQSGDSALIYNFPTSPAPWFGSAMPQDVYDSRTQIAIGYDTDIDAALDSVSTMAMPARMQMKMPASMMYPLESEYKSMKQSPRDLFVLRSEFK